MKTVHLDLLIIGAGQAGLALGYFLGDSGLNFRLVDKNRRVGDSWRNRYDSLVLFSPRSLSELPGLPLAGDPEQCPTKDELAQYLESYAQTFALPVEGGVEVRRLTKEANLFYAESSKGIWQARSVAITSGAFASPFIPEVPRKEAGWPPPGFSLPRSGQNNLFELHSSQYRHPSQLPAGRVLVVGGGNSAAQIARELANQYPVSLSCRHKLKFIPLKIFGKNFLWWLEQFGFLTAPSGSFRSLLIWLFSSPHQPIVGLELKELLAAGRIKSFPGVRRIEDNSIIFSNGQQSEFQTIIWATGFRPGLNWLKIKGALDQRGYPIHKNGVSAIPGLYFVGFHPDLRRAGLIRLAGYEAKQVASHIRESFT